MLTHSQGMYDSCLHVVHHSNGLTPRQVGNQIFRNESFQHSSLRLCSKWTVQKHQFTTCYYFYCGIIDSFPFQVYIQIEKE